MTKRRAIFAYEFGCELSIPEIRWRLDDRGPWRWIDRDNDRWGAYLSTRPIAAPHEGVAKILYDEGRYVINVVLGSHEPDAELAFSEVRKHVIDTILPALGATNIAVTDDYD